MLDLLLVKQLVLSNFVTCRYVYDTTFESMKKDFYRPKLRDAIERIVGQL